MLKQQHSIPRSRLQHLAEPGSLVENTTVAVTGCVQSCACCLEVAMFVLLYMWDCPMLARTTMCRKDVLKDSCVFWCPFRPVHSQVPQSFLGPSLEIVFQLRGPSAMSIAYLYKTNQCNDVGPEYGAGHSMLDSIAQT